MARFAEIGVGAGKTIDVGSLSPEMKTALEQGMADAWADFARLQEAERIDTKEVTSGDLLGTREHLKNNYLYRMAAAVLGHLRPLASRRPCTRSMRRTAEGGR